MYEVRDGSGALVGVMTLDMLAMMHSLGDETRARIEAGGCCEVLLRDRDGGVALALRRVMGFEDVPSVLRFQVMAGMMEEAAGYDLWDVVALMMEAMGPEEWLDRVRDAAAFSGPVC